MAIVVLWQLLFYVLTFPYPPSSRHKYSMQCDSNRYLLSIMSSSDCMRLGICGNLREGSNGAVNLIDGRRGIDQPELDDR